MKAAFILALSLSYAAPAFSQPANKAALIEARQFLTHCPAASDKLRSLCLVNQHNFLDNYVLAKTGNPMWMTDIAIRLDPDPGSGDAIGIRRDKRQACAWIIAAGESTTESTRLAATRERFVARCSQSTPNETRAMGERAEALLYQLRTAPAVAPKEEEVPLTAAETRCLDRTACGLDDDCPKFVPPPGCPRF